MTNPPNAAAYSRCSPLLTPLAYFLGRRLVIPWYFASVQISGQHHLPQTGPTIIAPTHRARWDSILVPLAVGRPATGRDLRFMVTADEVAGVQGWLIRRLGGFAVNIRRPSIASLRHGIDLLVAGEMLVIYPEGGIYREDQVQPLKPGLARLAIQAEATVANLGIQVLPVDLYYEETYPSWHSSMQVNIGEAIAVQEYLKGNDSPEALKSSAQALTQALQTRLNRMINHRKASIATSSSSHS
ncbi:MAG: lysophospholipid acyltransferase family protein [Nodosilinea sp.]